MGGGGQEGSWEAHHAGFRWRSLSGTRPPGSREAHVRHFSFCLLFRSFLILLKLVPEVLIVRRVGVVDTLRPPQLSSRYSFGVMVELGASGRLKIPARSRFVVFGNRCMANCCL